MGTYTLLFVMMTGNLILSVASQHEEEKKGKERTLIDTLWILFVFMAWIASVVFMLIWN